MLAFVLAPVVGGCDDGSEAEAAALVFAPASPLVPIPADRLAIPPHGASAVAHRASGSIGGVSEAHSGAILREQ